MKTRMYYEGIKQRNLVMIKVEANKQSTTSWMKTLHGPCLGKSNVDSIGGKELHKTSKNSHQNASWQWLHAGA